MTLSMPEARLVVHGIATAIIVTAKGYKLKSSEALRCPDLRCEASLGHVKGHLRDDSERTNDYFRRSPGSQHSPMCRFNVEGTVTRLIAKSECIDGPGGILGRTPDGLAIVRLKILLDALNSRTSSTNTNKASHFGIRAFFSEVDAGSREENATTQEDGAFSVIGRSWKTV